MAVRVALLVLTTGTFTALWSGDHPDQMSNVERPAKVLLSRPSRELDHWHTGFVSSPDLLEKSQIATSEWARATAPLPNGICPGTFLVVDQFGGTTVRVITQPEIPSSDRRAPATDHYSVTTGSARWHYVRIDDSLVNQTAVLPNDSNSFH